MGEKLLRSEENTGRVRAVAATLPRAAMEQPQAVSPGEIQVSEELLKSQSCLESHMDTVHRERPCQQPPVGSHSRCQATLLRTQAGLQESLWERLTLKHRSPKRAVGNRV